MNKIKFLIALTLVFVFTSCSEDDSLPEDNILEVVFLQTEELQLAEADNNTNNTALEVHAEILAFEAPSSDVTVSVSVTGSNATLGEDFQVVGASEIVIPAGSFVSSRGLRIKSIDNNAQTTEDRIITVTITGVSDESLTIGKGLGDDATNVSSLITIVDDECPDQIDIFNGGNWSFDGFDNYYSNEYSGGFSTTLSGNTLTIEGGDIMNYDLGITMDIELTESSPGSTTGTLTHVSSTEVNDGYFPYRWVLQSGSYDVCARSIDMNVSLQYLDDGTYGYAGEWLEWYNSDITGIMAECQEDVSRFGGSIVAGTSSGYGYDPFDPSFGVSISGDQLTLNGAVSDYHGENLTVTIVPDPGDPTIGTLTFTEELLGSPGDGAIYHLIPTDGQVSTYNACAGTITIYATYEWNFEAGAGWEYWYDTVFELSIQ
ncbi:hypothetical protein [Ekhidna sp.]